jgi:hypothetical protein
VPVKRFNATGTRIAWFPRQFLREYLTMRAGFARLRCAVAAALVFVGFVAWPAQAVTVTFTGSGGGQGVIGHGFVHRSATPWEAFYAAVGVLGPYTELVSPDAFDFATGNELAIGTNLPGIPFGATAPAPHGLEPVGIAGPLHVGFAGFTLDVGGADLAFLTPTHEHRIYRGGTVKFFEETAPGVFVEIASLIDAVLEFDINYLTGVLGGTTTGTRGPGTPAFFPESYSSIAFDPIDNAGVTAEGAYGRFSSELSFEFDLAAVPAPPALPLLGAGLLALPLLRRTRR